MKRFLIYHPTVPIGPLKGPTIAGYSKGRIAQDAHRIINSSPRGVEVHPRENASSSF